MMFLGSDGGSGKGRGGKREREGGSGESGGGIYYADCLYDYSNIKSISLNKLIIHKIYIEDNWVSLNSYIINKFISNINIMF